MTTTSPRYTRPRFTNRCASRVTGRIGSKKHKLVEGVEVDALERWVARRAAKESKVPPLNEVARRRVACGSAL